MNQLENILTLHARRYPAMEAADYIKLLYQSEFGPGHMVAEGDALACLQTEFARAEEEGYAPAYTIEAIGGGLCRFHLDPRTVTQADLPLLARCFSLSAKERGTMTGLWQKLGFLTALSWSGGIPQDVTTLEKTLAEYAAEGCPALHHSEGYREAFHPHYRVIDRDLSIYGPALKAIDTALRENEGPIIAAVDGRCASGKSTFAARCAQLFDCNVFHMDDFFLPPELRTPERLAAPGGNVHYERAAEEIFAPVSRGEAARHAAFDCHTFTMGETQTAPRKRLNIVEGSYALHPALAGYSRLHIFLTCSPEVQLSRLARRESPESLERFKERWIPMEEAYFSGLAIESQCDVVVDTSHLPTNV